MCSKCHATALPGSTYCELHRDAKAQSDKLQKTGNALRRFYNCKLWRVITRSKVLSKDPVCTHIADGKRCPELATDIHHVIDADIWVAQGNDFYDDDNLVGLFKSHHSRHTNQERWKHRG